MDSESLPSRPLTSSCASSSGPDKALQTGRSPSPSDSRSEGVVVCLPPCRVLLPIPTVGLGDGLSCSSSSPGGLGLPQGIDVDTPPATSVFTSAKLWKVESSSMRRWMQSGLRLSPRVVHMITMSPGRVRRRATSPLWVALVSDLNLSRSCSDVAFFSGVITMFVTRVIYVMVEK
ncbi:unnamed protein product [Choristocarpus tenellus]